MIKMLNIQIICHILFDVDIAYINLKLNKLSHLVISQEHFIFIL